MKNINILIKSFEQYAYAQSYPTALSDLLDYFIIPFKWYATKEDQADALNQLTNHNKKDILVSLITKIGELSEGFNDPLGALYEQLISKGKKGQFFTPEPIASFMAASVLHEHVKPGETVYDPACGSGRMLLAAAKINRHLRFYGADIDPLCCKISLVNMLLNSLTGEIAHMDTLANDFYKGYAIGTILKDGYHYPYYKEFTDLEESYIWLRPNAASGGKKFDTPFANTKCPLMHEGIQGNLFD